MCQSNYSDYNNEILITGGNMKFFLMFLIVLSFSISFNVFAKRGKAVGSPGGGGSVGTVKKANCKYYRWAKVIGCKSIPTPGIRTSVMKAEALKKLRAIGKSSYSSEKCVKKNGNLCKRYKLYGVK
jgi:hypothetical protein